MSAIGFMSVLNTYGLDYFSKRPHSQEHRNIKKKPSLQFRARRVKRAFLNV